MKNYLKVINLPSILLVSYLIFSSIKQTNFTHSIIISMLSLIYIFNLWISFKKSTTLTKEDDFVDLHKEIREAKLKKQLIQANADVVKLGKLLGDNNVEERPTKIRF